MNKSFKVVFSKARSALMVVNEATSSIQAKGTKTVIAAAAAAMIAGGAMAEGAGAVAAPAAVSEATVTGSLVWTPDATESSKSHYAGTDVTVVVNAEEAAVAWNETKLDHDISVFESRIKGHLPVKIQNIPLEFCKKIQYLK